MNKKIRKKKDKKSEQIKELCLHHFFIDCIEESVNVALVAILNETIKEK